MAKLMPRATCSPGVRPRTMATSDRLTDGDTEGKAVDEGLFDALLDVLGDGRRWSRRATPSSRHCDRLTIHTLPHTIVSARWTIQQGQPSFVGPLHGERTCVELLTDENHPIFDDPGFDAPRAIVS